MLLGAGVSDHLRIALLAAFRYCLYDDDQKRFEDG